MHRQTAASGQVGEVQATVSSITLRGNAWATVAAPVDAGDTIHFTVFIEGAVGEVIGFGSTDSAIGFPEPSDVYQFVGSQSFGNTVQPVPVGVPTRLSLPVLATRSRLVFIHDDDVAATLTSSVTFSDVALGDVDPLALVDEMPDAAEVDRQLLTAVQSIERHHRMVVFVLGSFWGIASLFVVWGAVRRRTPL